ncbi:Putative Holin-X, holin superfamily III [Streptomyces sp. DvalAA-14]|uniref:phage holin family protein n=1 Tax=unclassified Streptomyces TaxID=2593676 RepID=UPI00081B0C89|nr:MULTISPECIES: phage holin family protein [unclassified Streptomyces]MYS20866.1 phage holin family protein [Streptomyces sp. SID4948]SCD78714.1 Putative Holin-X, holin superfamily III [Streptomyces sp. DvalAA-14]
MSPAPEHNGDGRSIGQLFAAATAEMSALVHDEIALAKAELRQDARRAAIGSGALVVALALAIFAVPMGCMALAYVLHRTTLPLDACFGIVCGAFFVLAGLLGLLAVGRFKKVKKPELSISSAKETAAVLQKAKPHPRPLESAETKAIDARM